ncbi:MAG: polysaccharide biosynthesis protein [Pseudomonadales bacterium]|nr:polysaccharide biosynthesis protein [Pseudomonadales bacterium]
MTFPEESSRSAGTDQKVRDVNFKRNSAAIRQMAEIDLLDQKTLEEKKIIGPGTTQKEFLNTFREIRTKLVQLSNKKNFVAMVNSVVDGGGASFTALNLAAVFALDKSKTALLVDCNLYEPALHHVFDLQPEYGLTDYLEDSTLDIDDIIYATGIERLRLIPAGTFQEAGAEYFSSERMASFLEAVVARYPDRYIFLDSPPAAVSAEGRIIAELSDYGIIVVPYGKVTVQQIEATVAAIGKQKVAGVIFNN